MTTQLRFWLAVFVGASAAFLVWTEEVVLGTFRVLDRTFASFFGGLWREALHPLFQTIAELGGLELTALGAVGLAAYLVVRGFRREAWALLAFPLASLVEVLDKRVIAQPHPPPFHADGPSLSDLVESSAQLGANSYPSGHMVRSVIVYGLIAFVVYRLAPPGWARRVAVPLACVIIAVMAFDRLYLGVHWLSDVIGGLLLGGLTLSAAIIWLDRPRSASG